MAQIHFTAAFSPRFWNSRFNPVANNWLWNYQNHIPVTATVKKVRTRGRLDLHQGHVLFITPHSCIWQNMKKVKPHSYLCAALRRNLFFILHGHPGLPTQATPQELSRAPSQPQLLAQNQPHTPVIFITHLTSLTSCHVASTSKHRCRSQVWTSVPFTITTCPHPMVVFCPRILHYGLVAKGVVRKRQKTHT